MTEAKPFKISKVWLYTSYLKIRANGGTYGVDRESLEMFEQNREDNLYKIWNRMSSGSYMPPAVRRIEIPKKGGGTRPLGIPTVSDRIAQMVVREHLEPKCEVVFHGDSYAYRSNRSAHNAIRKARRRCLEYRWLKAPVQLTNGEMEARTRGTLQGSVISPLLANLFLHYAFDKWMNRNIPYCPFERYADDIVVHCNSLMQAKYIRAKIEERLKETGLVLHPEKTVIVYCIHGKDKGAANGYTLTQFDFLGFTFTTRSIRNFRKQINAYRIFSPAISMKAKVAIMDKVRSWRIRRQTNLNLEELSEMTNASIRGWIAYYGAFGRRELYRVFQNINEQLIGWMKKKYRISSARVAHRWLEKVTKNAPHLFAHWELLNCKTVGQ